MEALTDLGSLEQVGRACGILGRDAWAACVISWECGVPGAGGQASVVNPGEYCIAHAHTHICVHAPTQIHTHANAHTCMPRHAPVLVVMTPLQVGSGPSLPQGESFTSVKAQLLRATHMDVGVLAHKLLDAVGLVQQLSTANQQLRKVCKGGGGVVGLVQQLSTSNQQLHGVQGGATKQAVLWDFVSKEAVQSVGGCSKRSDMMGCHETSCALGLCLKGSCAKCGGLLQKN